MARLRVLCYTVRMEEAEEKEIIFSARVMLAAFALFLVAAYSWCAAQWHFAQRRIYAQVEANPSRKERLRALVPGMDGTMLLHKGISRPDVAVAIFDLHGDKRGRRKDCVILVEGDLVFARRSSPFMLPLVAAPNGYCLLDFDGKNFKVVMHGSYPWWRRKSLPSFEPDAEVLELVTVVLNVLQKSDDIEN